jgi:signal transduction histidine kinase
MAGRSATLETVDHTQDDETPVSDHPAIGTRFRFALNPQAEVAETMPELSDIGLAGAVGADMDTLIAGDPTPLANAIEARDTFNRVLIQWHTNDGGAPVNVLLSGLPLLDGEGGFYGLRAFGVIGARSGQSASNVSGSDEPTDADATKIAESGSAENAGLAPELSAAPAAETMVEATEPLDDQSTEQAALFDSEPSDPSGLSETADAADTGGIGDLASDATAEKHAHPAEDQGVSVDEALDNGVPDTASNRLKRLAAVGAGLAAAGTAAGLVRGDDNAPQTSQPNTGEEEPTLLTAADIPARRPMRPTEETLRASNGLARSDQAALDEIAERLGNGHAPVPVPVEDEPAPEMDPEMVTATGQDAADDIAGDPSPDPEQASQDAIGDSASSLEAAVPGSDGEPDSASDAPELRAEDGRVDDLLADKDEIESPGSDDPSDIGTDTRAGVPGDDEVPGRDDDRTEGVLLPFSRQRGETGSFADRIDVAREVANETGRDGGRKTGGARDWATIASAATALGGLGAGLGVMSGAGAQDSEDATEISDPEADQTADEAIDKASGADATPDVDRPDAQGNHLIELVDRLPLGMLFVRDENPLYANRAFLDLFGYADVDDLSHSGGMQALFENLSDTNKSGKRMLTGVTSDNRPFQVEARLQMARWIDGPALLLSIRERDQFDTAPLETADAENATLRDVLDTVPDAVIVTDLEGRIESANAPARSMLGPLDRSEMRPTLPALFAEDGQRALALAIETLSDFSRAEHDGDFRDPEPISATLIARDGNRIEAEVTLSSVGIGAREKICAVIRRIQVAGQDTSSAAESGAIAGANVLTGSDKSDVLAKVSHEIRTPVNAIIGFADMMLDEQYGPIGHERYAGYLKDIKTSGLHIVSLVNDLLDLSKVEAGMLDLDFAETALNDVVEQCTAIMQSQASRESVILRASLAQSLPPVVADVRSIRQILLNLLSNAIKFTPTGGQVIVSTVYADNGAVELRVRDTGVGMTEADIAQALEPYRQNTTTGPAHPNRGSGIGLPLTKALAEANRTQFSLNSVPGEGTTVHVIFPPTRVLAE